MRVLDTVKATVGAEAYADIVLYLAECGITSVYLIADQAHGKLQDDVEWAFGIPSVNQTCNGGFEGDCYAGTVSIPLGGGMFFQFSYEM